MASTTGVAVTKFGMIFFLNRKRNFAIEITKTVWMEYATNDFIDAANT